MANHIAYFAGGCFWCMTPIFKMVGADKVICGYSGGKEDNPTYEQVKKQQTGHRETMAVYYDDEKVSYERLVEIYLANVDPFDSQGQFIDRGFSYTLAIFPTCNEEERIAKEMINNFENKAKKKVFISIERFKKFYEAEEYHQDYYLKNKEKFKEEIIQSKRDVKKYNF